MEPRTTPSPAAPEGTAAAAAPSPRAEAAATPWHAKPTNVVLAALETSPDGLTDAEARRRLAQNGPNELASKPPKTLGAMVREQLGDPMVLILVVAAVLSALLREWAEAGIIFAIVVVNAVIGIVQERKAQSSLEALRSLSAPTARVVRGGAEEILPARDLVLGDVVLLDDGSMVPADLRLLDSASLRAQEASLTGESVPSEKDADAAVAPGAPLGDRSTMAFATSIVTGGRGRGVVTATGMGTEVGQIAGLLEGDEELDTPLKRKLASFGKLLTIVGVAAALAVVAIGLAYGRPFVPLLLLAVSLAISVIPESLPATATIVMALGVQRMARHEALVRRLPAVETLGGATVICTDKTGTLTENRMSVVRVALGPDLDRDTAQEPAAALAAHPALFGDLAFVAALCNDASFAEGEEAPGAAGNGGAEGERGPTEGGRPPAAADGTAAPDTVIGDPTEGALLVMARDIGVDPAALRASYPRLAERPFDSDRKRMATVHERDGQVVATVKGALDGLLPRCAFVMDDDGARPITDDDRAHALEVAARLSDEALRVLAFATRALPAVPGDEEDIERELVLVGLVGMMDPPRPDVRAAVDTCRTAGVRTVMITGDHAATARAIGEELDIYRPGDLVITGEELEEMDDAALDDAVRRASVFARVSPYHKLRIVRALKHDGEVTAMTGDGVNDAPALKAADIGVAMGITGTEVTKQSAKMILADDNFSTIVAAVREGRGIFDNIRKFLRYLLSSNVGEVFTVFLGVVLAGFLGIKNPDSVGVTVPLLATQLLWINLLTDAAPALAMGVDPTTEDVMNRKPRKLTDRVIDGAMWGDIVYIGLIMAIVTLIGMDMHLSGGVFTDRSVDALGHDAQMVEARTMGFTILVFAQLFNAIASRSHLQSAFKGLFSNKWLWGAIALSIVLQLLVIYVPWLNTAFGTTPLPPMAWLECIGLAAIVLVASEIRKIFLRMRATH